VTSQHRRQRSTRLRTEWAMPVLGHQSKSTRAMSPVATGGRSRAWYLKKGGHLRRASRFDACVRVNICNDLYPTPVRSTDSNQFLLRRQQSDGRPVVMLTTSFPGGPRGRPVRLHAAAHARRRGKSGFGRRCSGRTVRTSAIALCAGKARLVSLLQSDPQSLSIGKAPCRPHAAAGIVTAFALCRPAQTAVPRRGREARRGGRCAPSLPRAEPLPARASS
jgi:hypothetical protein